MATCSAFAEPPTPTPKRVSLMLDHPFLTVWDSLRPFVRCRCCFEITIACGHNRPHTHARYRTDSHKFRPVTCFEEQVTTKLSSTSRSLLTEMVTGTSAPNEITYRNLRPTLLETVSKKATMHFYASNITSKK